jgi:tRNA modification GTPase
MSRADRILYVIDGERRLQANEIDSELATLPTDIPATLVVNKIDLLGLSSRYEQSQPPRLYVSATTGEGVDLLREHLKECMGFQGADSGTVSARRRHLDALARTDRHLQEARRQLLDRRAGELMAEELRQAQQALAEITGAFTSDDLLGRIFASFCIGK